MSVLENYQKIINSITSISSNANLVVVCKNQPIEIIKILIDHGHIHFAENRVQEAKSKWSNLNSKNIQLHLIGSLQSNKAKQAFQIFNYIHSLDSEKLAQTFSNLESDSQKKIKYFIQVNIGNEPQKSGIDNSEVSNFVNYCLNDLKLNIVGLMCIPPVQEDANQSFKSLAELARVNNLNELSMGMSDDYQSAIKNGATFVRVGSKIFSEV
jgi:pyridoxal phosphate enzyme (YggS family)